MRLPKNLVDPQALARLRGSTSDAIVSNLDVAPSMAALGGAAPHSAWDGESWAGLLGLGGITGVAPPARRQVQLIEYWGEQSEPTLEPGCHKGFPPDFTGPTAFSWWQDQTQNTWSCMRAPPLGFSPAVDTMFCQWFATWEDKDSGTVSFEEYHLRDISILIRTLD